MGKSTFKKSSGYVLFLWGKWEYWKLRKQLKFTTRLKNASDQDALVMRALRSVGTAQKQYFWKIQEVKVLPLPHRHRGTPPFLVQVGSWGALGPIPSVMAMSVYNESFVIEQP